MFCRIIYGQSEIMVVANGGFFCVFHFSSEKKGAKSLLSIIEMGLSKFSLTGNAVIKSVKNGKKQQCGEKFVEKNVQPLHASSFLSDSEAMKNTNYDINVQK